MQDAENDDVVPGECPHPGQVTDALDAGRADTRVPQLDAELIGMKRELIAELGIGRADLRAAFFPDLLSDGARTLADDDAVTHAAPRST